MKRFLIAVLALLLCAATLASCSLQKKGTETTATDAFPDLPPQSTGTGTQQPEGTTGADATSTDATTTDAPSTDATTAEPEPPPATSGIETPPEDPDGDYTKNY